MARQHLGQHFLTDPYWREQIARAIRVLPPSEAPPTTFSNDANYCWIEIGPGHGEMTQYLAGGGVPLHVIELDPALIGTLNRLKTTFPNIEVLQGDILETDLRAIANNRRMRIYGSLPYYITSPILHHLFEFTELIDEIHVVVQREVAQRLAAQPGSRSYGYLSVATQLYLRPELVLEIPRLAFNPPPEVDSTLVTLRLPGERDKLHLPKSLLSIETESPDQAVRDDVAFLGFVKFCFSKKRKTLVNNLRSISHPQRLREALALLDLRPDVRAEHVSISKLAALYTSLQNFNALKFIPD